MKYLMKKGQADSKFQIRHNRNKGPRLDHYMVDLCGSPMCPSRSSDCQYLATPVARPVFVSYGMLGRLLHPVSIVCAAAWVEFATFLFDPHSKG